MSEANPYTPARICVTIKIPESAKWAGDDPWFVFEGTTTAAVRQQIIDAFGMEVDESLTLFDVTVNAERMAVTMGHAAHALGGTVLSRGSTESSEPAQSPANDAGGDVWTQAAAAQGAGTHSPPWDTGEKAPSDPILAGIESCATVAELQQLWAENQDAFNSNPAYMDAYKAKGRALSA